MSNDYEDLFAGMKTIDEVESDSDSSSNSSKIDNELDSALKSFEEKSNKGTTASGGAGWVDPRILEKRRKEREKKALEEKRKKQKMIASIIGGVVFVILVVLFYVFSQIRETQRKLKIEKFKKSIEVAKVSGVVGKVQIYDSKGIDISKPKSGTIIKKGYKLEVKSKGNKNRLVVEFPNGVKIYMFPGTEIIVKKLDYEGDEETLGTFDQAKASLKIKTNLELKKGMVTCQVPKLDADSFMIESYHLKIKNTPNKYTKFKIQEGKKTKKNRYKKKYFFIAVRNGKVTVFNKKTKKNVKVNEYYKYFATPKNYFSSKPIPFNPLSEPWN